MKEIPLTKGLVALVSDEDYAYLSKWKWSASLESRGTKWYAIRWSTKLEHGNGKRFKIRMHRLVAETQAAMSTGDFSDRSHLVVDHKDGNSLNNTRENLEYVTQSENMQRSPGWKGSRQFKANKSLTSTESSTPQIHLEISNSVENPNDSTAS